MKKLSFLLTVLACSWSMIMATNVKVRVLIPTDSEFTTTGDIVFTWTNTGSGATTPIVLNHEEATSRWWGATVIIPDETKFEYSLYTETSSTTKDVAQVGGWSPSSYVAKDKPELNFEIAALYDDSDPKQRIFLVEEVAATAPDHDYRIADLKVEDIGNGVTITWTANNLAPNYYIGIMDDANIWDHDEYVTVTEGKYTYYYDGTDDIHLGTLLFFPCFFDGVSDFHPYVRMFQNDLNIDFKNPEDILKKSLKAVLKNDTIEVSWEHYPAAAMYDVAVEYGNSWFKEQVVLPKYTSAQDGKYTLIFDGLPANGAYNVYFYAGNANGDALADLNSGVTVSGLPSLGEVDLRVLIPSDNDMDISYGVWFEWTDVETKTSTIVKADQDADGVWFSKKITTDKSAIQFRVCNRSDASGSNSSESPVINTNQACFEMQYQEAHAWELRPTECDAADHDYRMTDVKVALSDPVGQITFTITAKNYASAYKVEAHENGVGDFLTLAVLPYESSNIFTLPLPYTKAGTYEYRLTPIDKEYNTQVAQENVGTFTLTSGNINMPTELKAAVGTDKQTVTFSWAQPDPTTVDHYTLEVTDYGETYKVENIYNKNYSMKFYATRTHCFTWAVNAYNAEGVLLAQATQGDCVDIVSDDYSPKNLKVVVDGNKATFTWSTSTDVQISKLKVIDYKTGENIVNKEVSATDGQFSTSFTLKEDKTLILGWNVTPLSPEAIAMSEFVQGEMFTLVGKAPTPRVPQTKEMIPTYGHLSWDEASSTWGATVYEYNAAQEPVMVFTLSVSGNKTTVPATVTLTNNTSYGNLFSEIPTGGEDPQFGDVTKNANLTISYDGGLRTKDDGAGGKILYVLAKVSGEMNTEFGDKLIVKASADFIEFIINGIDLPTALDQIVNGQSSNRKFLRNGQILILRGDKVYTVTGQEVK